MLVLHWGSTSPRTLALGHAPSTTAATVPGDSVGEGLSLALRPGDHSFNVFWLSDTFGQLTQIIIPWFKKEASRKNQQAGGTGRRTGGPRSLHHLHFCGHEPEGNPHSQNVPREETIALPQERQGKEQETQGATPMPAPGAHPILLPSCAAHCGMYCYGRHWHRRQEAAPAAGRWGTKGGSIASGRFSPALAGPAVLSMAVGGEDVPQTQRRSWVPCSSCCELWL